MQNLPLDEPNRICTTCKVHKSDDEIIDKENDICETCYDKWFASEVAYWRPLYEGEKLAGLIPDKQE